MHRGQTDSETDCYEWICPIKSFFKLRTTTQPIVISPRVALKLAVVWELKSSLLMFYLCILQPPVSPPPFLPPFPYLSSLSRQKGTQSSCRAADWLSWRLSKIVCLHSVRVFMCVSHAIMEAVSKPERLTVSCLSNCWRQIDQCCCYRAAVCLKSCKGLLH